MLFLRFAVPATVLALCLESSPARADGPPTSAHPRFLLGGVRAALASNYAGGNPKPELAKVIASCPMPLLLAR